MGLPRRDAQHHTYGDYLGWSEDTRYELIEGVAYAMAPAPSRRHQEVLGELFRQVANALESNPCRAFIAPFDVRLPRGAEADDEIDTVVQPDLSVVCDAAKLDERGCRGAPDWVVEVLSPGTAGHDHILKRTAYERSGVREYWLVHPADRIVTVYRLEGNRYGVPEVRELAGRQAIGVLSQVEIDWDRFAALLAA
jgi:Uma2 family endonuclease